MGFGAEISDNSKLKVGELLKDIKPEDLLKYGLIPEFIGRIPVIVTLEELNESALVKILTEPKNALIKQYKELFSLDDVELEFEEDAIKEIAKKAFERKTGARALRSILEELLMDVMFEIPSDENIKKCVITKNCIKNDEKPKLIMKS